MSTKSTPPTDFYTLEFEQYDQIRGKPMEKDEPQFHYMQTGSGGQIVDPKTKKLIPAPEPKRPKVGQLYLALLDEIMEIELREVQNRFQSKRKPILDAIKLKKQTQNHH